ncbi:SHOCT domain-containing protein [Companilactobacillus ginsenosidimutans]|uniref:SHOCT domain-containing protein n=1 Tax=Companilactobacillus ginsenosidimutans TaxID=1007676 RepID=A0A0H4QJZ5_9LACO|nr:SHOCT domain-containing protein [Companilactobacillus ginsenosidimutans]AKP67381.1 hypothetical protein ABM34_07410 [Companilactobacillus ginsenosidimutans]
MIYDYSDLVSFHRNTVYKNVSKHHRITRGAVGGALFGGAGAVVGAMTGGKDYRAVKKMSVSVYFKNGPEFEQKYVQFETKEDSWSYRTASSSASQLEGHLRFIINQNATPVQVVAAPDSRQQPQPENESKVENDTSDKESFDQLRELKKLLDEGVITQDDFDSKKKKILGI